jgi:hypothetical protein
LATEGKKEGRKEKINNLMEDLLYFVTEIISMFIFATSENQIKIEKRENK